MPIQIKTPNLQLVLGSIAASVLLSACTTSSTLTSSYAPPIASNLTRTSGPSRDAGDEARDRAVASRPAPRVFDYASIYAAQSDDGVAVPAFGYRKMNARYLRKHVAYFGPERPGTIVIDAGNRLLYLVEANGMAMRYGIAVGKEGFGWTGNATLQWKQKWPTWTPPAEMIARTPSLKKYADGLKGSPANPLGARAMYLFKGGKDTMYRIHGTTKPYSIGKAASSGCFRMINQDVIDLYSRVTRKNSVQVRTRLAKNTVMDDR
ncbi:MAG: L,D-transpeptidase [Rhizobiaceae bacterium]